MTNLNFQSIIIQTQTVYIVSRESLVTQCNNKHLMLNISEANKPVMDLKGAKDSKIYMHIKPKVTQQDSIVTMMISVQCDSEHPKLV